MSSISDILAKKNLDEPEEIGIIKKYVRDTLKSDVSVVVQPKQIIISARSAALAGTLRMHSYQISEACQTEKRLVFKIGA